MATLTIDPQVSPRVITIASPTVLFTVQEIVDWCRAWEDSVEGHTFDRLINANGKQTLTATKSVGITATLLDAQIEWEDRAGPTLTRCTITDGNLLAVDSVGSDIDVVKESDFVFPVLELDTSAAIVETGVSGLTPTESATLSLLDNIEGSLDHQEIMRILLASAAGKLSGALLGTSSTIKIRDRADTKDRIEADVDANGNRTSVTLDTS